MTICCLVLCFPFIPPALPLFSFLSLSCPFQFTFVSLSFPVAFLSCRLSISTPHLLSRKKHGFPAFSQRGCPKTFSAKGERAGRGVRAWGPCLATPAPRRLRLVERHQIARSCAQSPNCAARAWGVRAGVEARRGGVGAYLLQLAQPEAAKA